MIVKQELSKNFETKGSYETDFDLEICIRAYILPRYMSYTA